jgi:hypothetical protein
MAGLASWIATLAALTFTGGALYVSLVEHPARLDCGPPMAVAEFRTSYPRAAALQGSLAAIACLAGAAAWLAGAPWGWLAAGLTVGSVIPFTLAAVMPTNRRLLDRALGPDVPEVRRLLRRWGWLHAVRTVLGAAGSVSMLLLLDGG